MKIFKSPLTVLVATILSIPTVIPVRAAVRYVNVASVSPFPPYTNWATATRIIQDAINAADAGDEIVVTNGVYQTGGFVVHETLTNRVAAAKPVTVRSVNGPEVTVIRGYQAPGSTNWDNAVRCVYLASGATLIGFTLTNGATQASGYPEPFGGGIFCEDATAIVSNCWLKGNSAGGSGGGAFGGTLIDCRLDGNSTSGRGGGAAGSLLNHCTLTGNSGAYGGGASDGGLNDCVLTGNLAYAGGGADDSTLFGCALSGNSSQLNGGGARVSTLNNCTVVENSASQRGGGAYNCVLSNCVVYYNTALEEANYSDDSTLDFCCTTPLLDYGMGNITDEPLLASYAHLSADSPCRGMGSAAFATGQDIDEESYANPPSIGCDEYYMGSITGLMTLRIEATYTNVASGFPVDFHSWIDGRVAASRWEFGDGTVLSNRPSVSRSWSTPGVYSVVLRAYNESYPEGLAATSIVRVVVAPAHYVSLTQSGSGPIPPYTSLATAATNIQDALNAATVPGALVLVDSGVYQSGQTDLGGYDNGGLNRVAVTKPLTLRSLNGPAATVILGQNGQNYSAHVRCAYVTNGATLTGFTLTNGGADYGGGVFCEFSGAVVSNCTFAGNWALQGGGAYRGTIKQCTFLTNSSYIGGGAACSTLQDCVLIGNWASENGGGVAYSTLDNCTLSGSVQSERGYREDDFGGGGAYSSRLNNCVLNANVAIECGGGAYSCVLRNCTLATNSTANVGGAACDSMVVNCTLTSNTAGSGGGAASSVLNNCFLTQNTANSAGGGALYGTLNNCTLIGNSAHQGGGTSGSRVNNSIVYYNSAMLLGYNSDAGLLNYSCTTPLPAAGTGNISSEPQLASLSHLSAASPCRGAGNFSFASGTDIDGELWANPPSIGCDEYFPGTITGPLTVSFQASYGSVKAGFTVDFQVQIDGRVSASRWEFGDGTVVSNSPFATHSWEMVGDYTVVLRAFNDTYPTGVSATGTVHVVETPVHYVSLNSSSPLAPYTSWATAARRIQDAIDAATVPGALIWVSNGVYQFGTRAAKGTMTNRVAATKPVTISSLNGPAVTFIRGSLVSVLGAKPGPGAIRCVYLTNGATLNGFTLTNGATSAPGGANSFDGGAIWCESTNALVTNCVFAGNAAYNAGGAAFFGTFYNCTFIGNSSGGIGGGAAYSTLIDCTFQGNSASWDGGGAAYGVLANCTITANSAWRGGGAAYCMINNSVLTSNSASDSGGGVYSNVLKNCTLTANWARNSGGGALASTLNNSIVYYNTALGNDSNYSLSTLNYSCTTPLPTDGVGNITDPPALASPSHLSPASPCRGMGSAAYSSGTDIDEETWANPPSIGCDEYHEGEVTGQLIVTIQATYTNVASGFAVDLQALIDGRVTSSRWDYGDGQGATNQPYASHSWATGGDYLVVLWAFNEDNPRGVSATLVMHVLEAPVYYVDRSNSNPVAPYLSWPTAATSIQAAVDAAAPGGLVLVTNGTYATGSAAVAGTTNRVALTKPLMVRSLNGPEVTAILGGGVRCAYLTNGATLTGFTLSNGVAGAGGGVWCDSVSGVVSNCALTANSASGSGGGAFSGTLNNCSFIGNSASFGGGVAFGVVNNCTLAGNSAHYIECSDDDGCDDYGHGGGASQSTLNNCTLANNSAGSGGGASDGSLNNCLLTGNWADYGGGAVSCTVNNCTITDNSGVGVGYCVLNNCIVFYNNYFGSGFNYDSSAIGFSCTTPLPPSGQGNFTNAPLFVNQAAGNLRPAADSPCINAGQNSFAPATFDLDGNPRIVGGTVDIGAYEFQSPQSLISYAWLQQFALPIDPTTDSADPDGDGSNNWQEWRAGTDPTSALSTLRLLTPTQIGPDLVVSWVSVPGKYYFLERSTNLGAHPTFEPLATHLPATATNMTTFTHTNAVVLGPCFYRVGVE